MNYNFKCNIYDKFNEIKVEIKNGKRILVVMVNTFLKK